MTPPFILTSTTLFYWNRQQPVTPLFNTERAHTKQTQ